MFSIEFDIYSVMQSDRNALKFNVVIIKLLRRHYRIMGFERIGNPWSKYILCYYFQNVSKRAIHSLMAHEKSLCLIVIKYL